MKTVHPVQSVLPSEPRPPARIGMDNSAPILSDSDNDMDSESRSGGDERVASGRLCACACA
jgi:hypothetical protein